MNNELKDSYLVLLHNENGEAGNGIIVGKHLITAGHCVGKEFTCAYTKAGQRIELNHYVAMRNDEKRDDGLFYDFAVFELEDVESPLRLACEHVKEGEEYTSLSIEHVVTKNDATGIFSVHEEFKPQEIRSRAIQRQGNFFACELEKRLKPGNSGSPLIKDGKVYGILHGGQESEEDPEKNGRICTYMAAAAINSIINNE